MRQLIRSVQLSLLLTSLALFAFAPLTRLRADTSNAGKNIWEGKSGGFIIRWSTSDIMAQSTSNLKKVVFSARSLAQKDLDDVISKGRESYGERNPIVLYERKFTVLSVAGSMISLKDHYFASFKREAHPAGETRFATIDLAKEGEIGDKDVTDSLNTHLAGSGKVVKLTDFFSESDVLHALLDDPLVRKALQNSGDPTPPNTLAKLIAQFSSAPIVEGECYSVSDDLLTRFAFHHIEKGKVAVRLGLSGAGPCREALTQLGILLPIPESLKGSLALAESRKEGFLMKTQEKIAPNQKTTLTFSASKDAGH